MITGWTLKGQWLNLLIFMGGIATLIGGNVPDTWNAIPAAITPKSVLGFIIALSGYLRSINTERPRDSYTERRTDPPADRLGDPPKPDV